MKGKQASQTKLNEELRAYFVDRMAEKATPEYFDGMLGQMHRRLRQELVGRPRWWDRLAELLSPVLPEWRPLLVRYALPLALVGAVGTFAWQHERPTPSPAQTQKVALEAGASPSAGESPLLAQAVGTTPYLLGEMPGVGWPSVVAPTTASGVEGGRVAKAKDRENGGRSFVSVLPVRYEASVDF